MKTSSNRKSHSSDRPVVLIMAGGKGERFWPRSTKACPKQLQKIYSNKTLLQETIDRARHLTTADRIYVGCTLATKKAILKGHRLPDANFVIEPEARNTAPIVALAALQLEKKYPGAAQVILSADHFIHPVDKFVEAMKAGLELASRDLLVTCGVVPSRPDPGYGYIQPEAGPLSDSVGRRIVEFHEKPDAKRAAEYVKNGFFWNSGIFIWKGTTILSEFERHAPEIIAPLRSGLKNKSELRRAYGKIPELPIDVAIMEKSDRRAVIPATFQWDDVGSWLAVERIHNSDADDSGNVFVGKSIPSIALNASGNLIVPNSRRLVALLGVKDLVFVETDTAVLISTRDGLGDIKKLLHHIREKPALQSFLE